jgi:GT2 family glycosyltransferase
MNNTEKKPTLRVLVINLNNLEYTKDCLDNLLTQSYLDFKITVIDQNSSQQNTKEILNSYKSSNINIVYHSENKPLNHVWNWFATNYNEDILCFLNNDVIITNNFIVDIINVFEMEDNVGVVVHATNHEDYTQNNTQTKYIICEKDKYMQGWDFSIRRSLFKKIPLELITYCGDDFIFQSIYNSNYNIAYVTSSPMIHFQGKSEKDKLSNCTADISVYKKLGYDHHLKINQQYSKVRPSSNIISIFRKNNQ